MSGATTDHRLLSVEEAARRLGASWATVRDLIETGQLRAVKVGSRYRVPTSALGELGAVHQSGAPVHQSDGPGITRDQTAVLRQPISIKRPLRG